MCGIILKPSCSKRKNIPVSTIFFVQTQTNTKREKCVQQDIAVQSYLGFLDLITVLGMHSLMVECRRYISLKIHDNSVALMERLEINLTRKALECNQM